MGFSGLLTSFIVAFAAAAAATPCSILALSGGGSFGAVELGILDGLVESQQVPDQFDIVTGISAGGLNAGFLSYYANVSTALPELHTIVSDLSTAKVYTSDVFGVLSEWSIYNTAPLNATLTGILSGRVAESGAPLTLVGATNVNTQTLDVFTFSSLATVEDRVSVLLATSAIPLAFPPRTINGSLYVDGGVINNEMITQAMGLMPCDMYDVTFISASPAAATGRQTVTGLFSFLSAVIRLLLNTFDDQIAQLASVTCPFPRGTIRAYYPTAPELAAYSILNFDYGAILWDLGKNAYNMTTFPLC